MVDRFVAVHVVPTGIGAQIGGFVGDAVPASNLLSSVCDHLIVHPNIVNGVALNMMRSNSLYVEGFWLDAFFREEVALRPVRSNALGVVLDCGCPDKKSIDLALNTIDALRTNEGINIVEVLETKKPVGGKSFQTPSGAFLGSIQNPDAFLGGAEELKKKGATAIALATYIRADPKAVRLYFQGKLPNPYGGLETLVSHASSFVTRLPCAHAPLVSKKEVEDFMFNGVVDPRAGAEAMGPAYLGCILQGLHRAPQPVPFKMAESMDVKLEEVRAVVCPADAMGGIPMLIADAKGIPVIGVKENKTVLKVSPQTVGLKHAIMVENYWEAAGILAALKDGIEPHAVRRPFPRLHMHLKKR